MHICRDRINGLSSLYTKGTMDWKTENCKQLYNDLVKVVRKGRKSHFFGSIVSVHNDGEFNELLVIDGQQRLTTISLLLLAMYNLMKQGILTPSKGNLAEKIYKTYLIDEWQEMRPGLN